MSLNVALIDKSEIIKKMLSHSLHYYAAEIHRFETLDDLKSQAKHINLDIIFIDWEIKKGNEPIALLAKKEITKTPLVVLYRNESDEKMNSITNRIKKPLDANLLRKMVADLIPKIGHSKIHRFLKFPKGQNIIKEFDVPNKKTKKEPTSIDFNLPNIKEENQDIQRTNQPIEKPPKKIPLADEIKLDLPEKTVEDDKLLVKSGDDQTSFKPVKQKSSSNQQISKPQSKKPSFDKENIKLDETTQNEFAPMAIDTVSSYKEKTNTNLTTQNKKRIQVTDEMILKVLEEYKNTLEFENLMERSLKNYAQSVSQKILAKDEGEILKKSLAEFKKEDDFKGLILKTLREYIKSNSEFHTLFKKELQEFIVKELPRLAKEIIETEIRKTLEEES